MTFVNALTWQDDEERGLLVPILHERTGGTSFFGATADRLGDDEWIICYWRKVLTPADDWEQVCFVHPPNGVAIPWCDDALYPSVGESTWAKLIGEDCECLIGVNRPAVWDPDLGTAGGYSAEWLCPEVGTVRVEWVPTGPGTVADVRWEVEFFSNNVSRGMVVANADCGLLPPSISLTMPAGMPCAGSDYRVFLSE